MYVRQQDGDIRFALLPGTNSLKTDAEIPAESGQGIDAIKPKLDELKAVDSVFPCRRRFADRAPEGPAKAIRKYRQTHRLDVRR